MKTEVLPMIGVLFSGSFLCRCFTGDALHNTRTHTHTHALLKPILTHSELKPDVLVQSHNLFHKVCELKVREVMRWAGFVLFGGRKTTEGLLCTPVCLGKHLPQFEKQTHLRHSPHTRPEVPESFRNLYFPKCFHNKCFSQAVINSEISNLELYQQAILWTS